LPTEFRLATGAGLAAISIPLNVKVDEFDLHIGNGCAGLSTVAFSSRFDVNLASRELHRQLNSKLGAKVEIVIFSLDRQIVRDGVFNARTNYPP
jgi:hypothetical protein